jgi:four helix bundle protein
MPPQDIRERAIDYVVRAVKVSAYLRKRRDDAGMIFGKQYLRAAGSIGANLTEAQAGESKPDFIHKTSIAQKEARECLYWLTVLQRAGLVSPKRISALLKETNEMIAIITAILVSAKKPKQP